MSAVFGWIMAVVLVMLCAASTGAAAAIDLTAEERAWLDAHPEIEVYTSDNAPPYQYHSIAGAPIGITIDLLAVIEQRLGIDIRIVQLSQAEAVEGVLTGESPVSGLWPSSQADPELPYRATRPVVEAHVSFFGNREAQFQDQPQQLRGKTISVPTDLKQFAENLDLGRHNEILLQPDERSAIASILGGQADYAIAVDEVSKSLLREFQAGSIRKIYIFPEPVKGVFMVPDDEPLLWSIMDKAIADIETEELPRILDKWLQRDIERPGLDLNDDERAWLAAHPVIEVHTSENTPPFQYRSNAGLPVGITIDLLEAIEQRLGIDIRVNQLPVKDIVEGLSKGEFQSAGLWVFAQDWPELPYRATQTVVEGFTSLFGTDISELQLEPQLLRAKTIAVPFVLQKFANSLSLDRHNKLLVVPDGREAVAAVLSGHADYLLGIDEIIKYRLRTTQASSIRRLYTFPKPGQGVLMVRNDEPQLLAIMNKAIAVIETEELPRILDKWLQRESERPGLDLSDDERAWLAAHPVIRVMNEPDYAPFDFQRSGKPAGYSIDYVNLLAQRLGVRLEFVQDGFGNLLQKAQRREIDLLHSLTATLPEREVYLNFTRPYKKTLMAIVTRGDEAEITALDDLHDRSVAMVTGDAIMHSLPRRFPNLRVVEVDNYEAALKAVAFGRADATVTELPIATYLMRSLALINLKIAAEFRSPEGRERTYRLAVRKDWPELVPILEKAMDSLGADELAVLDDRWLAPVEGEIRSETTAPETTRDLPGLQTPIIVGLLVLLIMATTLLLFRMLERSQKEAGVFLLSSTAGRRNIVLMNALFLALVSVLAWWGLGTIKAKVKQDTREALQTVLLTTKEAMNIWAQDQRGALEEIAKNSLVIEIATHQHKHDGLKAKLLASPELVKLRALFSEHQRRSKHIGFFVIAADGTSLASMRDANIGSVNPIQQHRPDLLQRVFDGESLLIPPLPSDLPLQGAANIAGKDRPPTMFFATPDPRCRGPGHRRAGPAFRPAWRLQPNQSAGTGR